MKKSIAYTILVFLTAVSVATLCSPLVMAQQETRTFSTLLLASNEVPPVSNGDSGASGTAIVTLTITRDGGGNITAATARFDVSINGLAVSQNIILAHIHLGPAGVNGPVRVDSGISPASPVPVTNGQASFTRTNLATTPADAQGIINNPAGWYFNVHSNSSPGGVVRGQLVSNPRRGR
jgi:CHRD domain-containing protein